VSQVGRVKTEEEILDALDHPFLPTMFAKFQTNHHVNFLLEYCGGGELYQLLLKQPGARFTASASPSQAPSMSPSLAPSASPSQAPSASPSAALKHDDALTGAECITIANQKQPNLSRERIRSYVSSRRIFAAIIG